jgi:hypothetical protein
VNRIILKVIAYVSSALALVVCSFIFFDRTFIINVFAMAVALYAGISIVVGIELKNLWKVFVISFPAIIISDLCFNSLQQFIAFLISFFVLLVIIRYALIKDHDSGWFGAICVQIIGQIFLLVIELVLAIAHMFLL